MKDLATLKKEKVRARDARKIPNILSFFRMAAALVFLAAGIFNIDQLWVIILYLVAVISDKADGIIARHTNTQTKLGLLLESIADTLLSLSLVVFVFLRRDLPHWIFTLAVVLFAILVVVHAVMYARRKFFFISSLNSSRVAIFFLHLMGIFYLFTLPYKEIALALVVAAGLAAYTQNIFKILTARHEHDI